MTYYDLHYNTPLLHDLLGLAVGDEPEGQPGQVHDVQGPLAADRWGRCKTNGAAAKLMNFERLGKRYALALLGRYK